MVLSKEELIELNRKLGEEFNTGYGLGGNSSNLDFALSLSDPYMISKEISRGHPFVDANKRTALMVYLIMTSKKTYDKILDDFYDIFLALSK